MLLALFENSQTLKIIFEDYKHKFSKCLNLFKFWRSSEGCNFELLVN